MEPVSTRHWVPRSSEAVAEREGELARALDLTTLTARILLARGIASPDEARFFIDGKLADLPDPFTLLGMESAVARLLRAWRRQERVRIHGDYDVDGITATALLTEGFSQLGLQVDYHIPLRLKDGYGLSVEALETAVAEGVAVVVSVDCGVSAVAEAERARELGLDLIVTDHHQVPEKLPRAHALINPHQPGCPFPFKDLAGVGVAFFLLVALRKALREAGAFAESKEPDLRRLLDLVALGSIADLVPLTGLNRLLTRIGLQLLDKQPRPGIHALRQVAAVDKVTCGTVGFRLAPRLNAAGRLEDAALGVQLLLGREASACLELAQLLDGFNRERQAIEKETLEQAVATLEAGRETATHSIVLADARWHPGVIGIVASRLVERYHRPTVLISLDGGQGKGSARSIRGFHLYQALERCRERLLGFGGHAYAAGLSLAEAEVPEFARAFEEVAQELLTPEGLHPHLGHDGELLLEELDSATVGELARLAPFGMGNPEPAFVVSGVRIQQAAVVGSDHLRFVARQDGYSLPCIAFGMAARQGELSGPMDLLFSPSINEWKGRFDVQLQIKDFRPSA
ncbi:single-stranded-DNA-specific exonuclease RecJ [Trichloromonas acetexigens]|uniref:Single-stranded-DNA-specific exonuclease RecJ n=1 Tax=Trichloromonas acetexigens TaxID=38815 RepID=A0A550JKK3_9BACT|nr:single-stranded-DNA-specific exonuclease RecJ [Desulfuromonas acetexigens]TRO83725.1 single-stranded-DNA-specific exonuclease RecJ [Desulfuromonas acetexigens]